MEEAKLICSDATPDNAAWFFKKERVHLKVQDFGWLLLSTIQDCWLVVNLPSFLFNKYYLYELSAFTAPLSPFLNQIVQNNYDEGVFCISYNRFSHDVTWRRFHLSPCPGVRSSLKKSDLILWPAFPVSASSLSRLIFLCSSAVLSQFHADILNISSHRVGVQ